MLDVKDLEKGHEARREIRRREEPAFRDIARIIRPDEQSFERGERVDRDDYDVFDSTPLYALTEFGSGMFGEATNPAERWFELTTGDDDLDKWGPVKAWLWGEASLMFNSLSPSVSSFYPTAPAWFANVGAFGNSFLSQEEWVGRQYIIDRNIPIGQCYFDVDAADNMNVFDREFTLRGDQTKSRYGDKAKDLSDDKTYTLIHSVYENPAYQFGRLGPRGMRYASTVFSPDDRNFRLDEAFYEMPYHALFWDKRSGRPWASGPGHNARADMNVNNEMARANMVDAQFAAEPMILTAKEGLFTSADIFPNAILEGAMSGEGKKRVDYLQRGDNPARAENKQQQIQKSIREAFFFSLMQVQDRPQMTATEFMGWKAERLRQLGPNLVRVQQGLSSFIARRYRILSRAGQTTPMPPELRGRNIAVRFVSPLAKAQKLATGQAVMQWIGMLGQIADAAQDPSILDVVNKDGASRVLHDAIVGNPDVINDQQTVASIRQQRAQQQQQQQQLEQAAQGAGIIADVAHAGQAMTLANGRGASGKAAA